MVGANNSPAQRALTLPTISDFSPDIIGDLAVLMKRLSTTKFDKRNALSEALEECFPHLERKRLGNISGTLKSFELIERSPVCLSNLGQEIAELFEGPLPQMGSRGVLDVPENEARAVAAAKLLSAHILLHLNGLKLIEAIIMMNEREEKITKISLVNTLASMGVGGLANGTTKHIALNNWFVKAGLVVHRGSKYEVDDAALEAVAGLKGADMDVLSALNSAQRMFLERFKVRARVKPFDFIHASLVYGECKRTSEALFGKLQDKIHKELVEPLRQGGWIEIEPRKSVGRGGTGARIRATAKLLAVPLDSVLKQFSPDLSSALRAAQRTALSEIKTMLGDPSKDVRGRGLEILALRMVIDLGLEPRGFRLINQDTTGGTEVDLLAEGSQLTFTRWSIQCKCHAHDTFKEQRVVKPSAENVSGMQQGLAKTNTVGAGTVSKEVGVAVVSQAHVIMLVTTSKFTRDAYEYAVAASEKTMLQFIFVDSVLVDRYLLKGGAVALTEHVLKSTKDTMMRRRLPWDYESVTARLETPAQVTERDASELPVLELT